MFHICEKMFFHICEKIFSIKECPKAQLYLRENFFYICEKNVFTKKRLRAQYWYKWVYMRMGFLILLETERGCPKAQL